VKWAIRSVKPSCFEIVSDGIQEIQEAGWSRAQILSNLADPGARSWITQVSDGISAAAEGSELGTRGTGGVGGEGGVGAAILGFVIARRVVEVLEIDLLGVRPALRRRGLARGLLGALIEDESRSGMTETRLELASANEAARNLYEGLGFVVVGRRTRYYPDGGDALMLSRFGT
jgi:ribosomal protein S18 acetylase RimI-like enzyme